MQMADPDGLSTRMNARMDGLSTRMDAQMDGLSIRMGEFSTRIQKLHSRLDKIDDALADRSRAPNTQMTTRGQNIGASDASARLELEAIQNRLAPNVGKVVYTYTDLDLLVFFGVVLILLLACMVLIEMMISIRTR
jgi:hypothetical protein